MYKFIASALVAVTVLVAAGSIAAAKEADKRPVIEVVKVGSAQLNVIEIRSPKKDQNCVDPYGDDAWGSDVAEECVR